MVTVTARSGTPGGSPYLMALKEPGVARICAFGVLGRLPDSMVAITLLLITKGRGGYALGGLLVGAMGLAAAISGPVWGRIADRRGARAVLVATGSGQALALLALGPAARHGALLGLVTAIVTGALRSPTSSIVRAQWAALPGEARRVMQALESALTELVFVIGPVLVGLVLLVASAGWALVVAAIMVAVGCLGLAMTPTLRPGVRSTGARDLWGPVRLPAVRLLGLVFFLQIVAMAGAEVGLTTLCANTGHTAVGGPLIGVWAIGSGIGGLAYGRRVRPGAPLRQLIVLTTAAGILLGLFLVSGNPLVLFAVAIPAGLTIAPGAQTVNGMLARVVPQHQHAEAFGWVSGAAPALGGSGGYALAAGLAQASGPRTALAVSVLIALLAPLVVVVGRRHLST